MKLLSLILMIYNWGVVCILLFFLLGIARFFEERVSRRNVEQKGRSLYQFFLIPVVLFMTSAIIYLFNERLIVGNALADGLRAIGGLILLLIGYSLFNTMMGGKS